MKSLLELEEGLVTDLKNASISTKALKDFLPKGVSLLQKHFKSKYVSVYLSVKEPSLNFYYSLDENGKCTEGMESGSTITAGEGFIGQLFDDQLKYCKAYVFSELMPEIDSNDLSSMGNYPTFEKNILAILLTGQNRILGAIEFVDSEIDVGESNNYILSAYIASQVFSRAVGSLFRGDVVSILESLSIMEIKVLNRELNKDEYLKEVANRIVDNDLINYYVSIIRVFSKYEKGVKDEAVSSNSDIDWSHYKKNKYPATVSFSTECYISGKTKIINTIDEENILGFENSEWILENKLKAYICIPIKFSGKCIGTLSLFLRYPYHFYNADFLFLNLLSHSIGKTIGLEERMSEVGKEIAESMRGTVRELSDLVSIKEFSHAYKNDIRIIKNILDKIIPSLTKKRKEEMLALSCFLDERKSGLESLIKSSRGKYGARRTFSLNDLLDEISSHFRTELELEKIKVKKSYGDVPDVTMDKNRMLEAVSNVFLNAIKSFQESSARNDRVISISTYIDSSFNDYCIVISDNGIGIKSELLPDKLFEEGVSGFRESEGTGQGLFYSKSILDSFAGEIEIISSVGKGATFTIRFPKDLFEGK